MIITTILLTIFLSISIYVNYNLYTKVNTYERQINRIIIKDNEYVKYYEVILKIILEAELEMQRIDFRGSFKSDDEVGFTFNALRTCVQNLANKIKEINEESENDDVSE